ncbi:Transmembrane protein [Phytophthora megakarya]|uniref:Transmembrane protein n=1 Tax=Phytophthora megakarya TaxID=4795 RepID=A0A225V3B9_9STRA|nr:Transmembrane protein [Phytophthora megakarya]
MRILMRQIFLLFIDTTSKCNGKYYKPILLSDLLDTVGVAPISATTESQINGYRVVRRQEATLSGDAYATYADTCTLISTSLNMILDTCDNDLGYNVA